MKVFYLLLVAMLIVTGCGKPTETIDPPIVDPPPPVEKSELNLLLFAAPWCQPCKAELPEIQRLYDEQLSDYSEQLQVTVYIETGAKQTQLPTQAIADQYGQQLGLNFDMRPDVTEGMKFPKWPLYRSYFSTGLTLPTAVVLDEEGNVLKTFNPSTPSAVVNYIKTALQ